MTKGMNHRVLHLLVTLLIAVVFASFSGCAKDKPLKFDYNNDSGPAIPYPDVSFAVISDIHLYHPLLGSSGAAFEKTLNSDRKLLLDSIDLLDYASGEIIASGARFVLINGDLTKDGEMANHRIMAQKLKRFTDSGIAVFVVPGNHDINNPDSVSYSGDSVSAIPTISAEEFASIYRDFGFGSALARDADSLSYVAEPIEGLWLLCIDDCRYRENVPGKMEIVSGKISQKTADWIADVLKKRGGEKQGCNGDDAPRRC
jgi:3',5'-cyclic AMP phosphodiesterase CpdA